jgi:prepilin-type N-terminal cleavage/methylation domain-containing protein
MVGWRGYARDRAGYSLVELIVVLAIIGVLLSIGTFSFHGWQVKSTVEAQVRQMVTDISELRVRAMTMKQRHSVQVSASGYVFKSYSSDDEPKCTGGTVLTGKTFSVPYKLKKDATNYYAGTCLNVGGDTLEIDQRGMLVGSKATVFVDYVGSANLDCLSINTVRVNPGKKDATGAICNDQ